MGEIDKVFEDLDDPRVGNAERHPLHDIWVVAICTLRCGGEACTDMAPFGRAKRDSQPRYLLPGVPTAGSPGIP